MIKKIYQSFDSKIKNKLKIFFILTVIFVLIEVFLIGSLYPIFQNFFSEQSQNNSFLNSFFNTHKLSQKSLLISVGILVILRFFYFLFFNFYKNKFLQELQKTAAEKLFYNFFINKSFESFISYNSSTLIRDLVNETQTFKKFVNVAISLFVEILLILFISMFLIILNLKIFFTVISFLLLIGLIYFVILKSQLNSLGSDRIITVKNIIKNITESFKFFEIIRIHNKLSYFYEINSNNYKKLNNILIKINIFQVLPRVIVETIFFLVVLILMFSISKSSNMSIDFFLLTIFFVAFLRIYPSFVKIINSIQDLNLFKKSVEGIYSQIFPKNSKDEIIENSKEILELKNSIRIDNFTFQYKSKYIFKNFDFNIGKNSFNAIVGRSGSGKSTLIKTLLGLLKPENVNVFFDEKQTDFKKLNTFFRAKVGYAGQNNLVLNSPLFENITLDKNHINFSAHTKSKLKNAFIDSGLNEFFEFEHDLNKIIDEDGKNVSGGQMQRISLARALFFSNGILILDEICSSLDLESEKKIIKILKKLSSEYMILYITHRDNFFDEFDQVIKIN